MANALFRSLLAGICLMLSAGAYASVSTVDRVRVLDGRVAETLYYYQNNWLVYRVAAARAGHIESYELLVDRSVAGDETLLLITVYRDREQYEAREANFAELMTAASPSGPRLLNDLRPPEFREVEDLGTFESLATSATPP